MLTFSSFLTNTASRWRVSALLLLLGVSLTSPVRAADDPYKIVAVRQSWSNDLIQVGKVWRKDLSKRIQASLRVDADTPASSIFVKAYFYDHADKLVATYNKPNKIWTETSRGTEEVGLPDTLLRTKTTDVYFALPEDLEAKKWSTVLIVFGNAGKVAVCANPASALPKLDFPEKPSLAAKTP